MHPRPLLVILLIPIAAGCSTRTPPGAAEASTVPAAAARKGPVRLIAVGDLMLGTSVKEVVLTHGASYPFRNYRVLLGEADLAFGNLETPLSERGTATPGKSKESLANRTNYIFRAPLSSAAGLAKAGFDSVSLANNHSMDYGAVALRDTLAALDEAGVERVGAGESYAESMRPVFLQRNGQRFAFFAVSDVLPLYSVAGKRTPGVAPARGAQFEKDMPRLFREARKKADWVLVSVHWGKEGYTGSTPKQRRLGRKLIDWGADVVIGHHTHVLGPIEKYHGGLIHYSLGNFVSHTGSRKNVTAWEVSFRPGERPTQQSFQFTWDGVALNPPAELKTAGSKRAGVLDRRPQPHR